MNAIFNLLKIQLLSFFGINKVLHCKEPKEKRKLLFFMILYFVVFLFICFISFLYSFGMSYSFETLQSMRLLPAVMMLAASIVMLFTTIYKVTEILFAYKDYDIIMSLPVKTEIIIASRLMLLYIMNFFFTVIILVPAMIVYGIKVSPSSLFYVLSIITLFFVPLIPVIAATMIGTIITVISSRFKHSNLISILLSFFALIGFMLLLGNFSTITAPQLESLGQQLMDILRSVYPLVILYIDGICDGNILSVLQFIAISLFAFILYIFIITNFYKKIHTTLTTFHTKRNYVLKDSNQSSAFYALYQKEQKRYFSSTPYVLNTGASVILLLLFSIMLCFFQPQQIEEFIQISGLSSILYTLAPLVCSFFLILSSTTSCSISLEGKSFWLLKSLPLNAKDIFLSKVLVNTTLSFPVIIINGILFTICLELNLYSALLLFITPAVYCIFIAFLGLVINLHFPVLDWMNEITVIKQGSAVLFTMIGGFISIAVPFAAAFLVPVAYQSIVITVTVLIITILIFLLYRYLLTKGADLLHSIDE